MRVPSLAIYTLAVLAAADLGSHALASNTSSPTQTPEAEATNLVVPVNSATPVATTSTQKLADANPVVPVNSATPQLADAKVVVPVNSATPVATTSTQKLADAKVVVPVNTATPVATTSTQKLADAKVVVPLILPHHYQQLQLQNQQMVTEWLSQLIVPRQHQLGQLRHQKL
jgi:hypothetical protein